VPHGRYLLPHEGVPQGLAATYTCSGITALSALKKTRKHLGADDHLVIIGAGGVGGSAVHIAPAAVAGKIIGRDIDAQKRAQARRWVDRDHRQCRPDAGQTGDGGDRRGCGCGDRLRRLAQDDGVRGQHPEERRQARHGRALWRRPPDFDRAVPVQDDEIEGSYVGTIDDLRELLALVQAGKVRRSRSKTRPARRRARR